MIKESQSVAMFWPNSIIVFCSCIRVLAEKFHLNDHKDNLKSGIVLDLYFYTVQFARENEFNKEKLSAVFSIVKKTHEVCIGKTYSA